MIDLRGILTCVNISGYSPEVTITFDEGDNVQFPVSKEQATELVKYFNKIVKITIEGT